MIFTSLILTIFVNIMDFFYLYLLQKISDVNIHKIIISSFSTWNYFI